MSSPQSFKIYCAGRFITTTAKHYVIYLFDGSEVGITFLAGYAELDQAMKFALISL